MPIEFSTSLELDLLYARWWGVVTLDEFKENFANYLSDAHYRPGRPELVDVSELEDFQINFKTASAMVRMVNEQSPGAAVNTPTVIYSPNEAIYGLGRMYQQLAELADGIQVQIYRHERAALAALHMKQQRIAELLAENTFLPHQKNGGRLVAP